MLKFILSYKYRTLFLSVFIIVGLVSSKAVMSIGVIALFINILLDLNYKDAIVNFYKNKKLFSISLLFFASLVALSYSANVANGFNFVLNKLPLFVIPLAYSKMDKMTKNDFLFILNFFVFVIFFTSLVVLYKYLSHYELANISLKKGNAIWVPFNHIRFNIMLVFAFISSVYLYSQKAYFVFKIFPKFKYFFLFQSIFFFILIHILSVRSGLLVLYIILLVSIILFFIKNKSYRFLSLGLILLIALPIISYTQIESFRNKIHYMAYDWEHVNSKQIGSNSDSRRIVSYRLGFQLLKKSFPLGLGTGSIQKEMAQLYAKDYADISLSNRIMPHNQFLYTTIDYGILGLIAICFTVFFPFLTLKNKRENIFYISFWILSIIPLLFDISLEMQLGITFFALFSSLILKQIALSRQNE